MTGITDNQGNPFIMNKLMTTRFPVNVILMEAASLMESRSQWLDLTWTGRENNVEADQLTNEDFSSFDAKNRIEVQVTPERFPVLFKMLGKGRGRMLFEEIQTRRAENRERGIVIHDKKRKKKMYEKKSW